MQLILAVAFLAAATVQAKRAGRYPAEHRPPVYKDPSLKLKDIPEGRPLIPTPGQYNTTGGPVAGKLNVHVVCHTHV